MELIPRVATVRLTEKMAEFIEQLCAGAWKGGGVRDPGDAAILEELRKRVKSAFEVPEKKTEEKK